MARTKLDSSKTKLFQLLASELSTHFPDLDLRFNLNDNSPHFRCILPEFDNHEIEIGLTETAAAQEHILSSAQDSLHDAIFAVKEITKRFDA